MGAGTNRGLPEKPDGMQLTETLGEPAMLTWRIR